MAVLAAPHAHEVHLWRAPLDISAQLASGFGDTLSTPERARAARLRDAVARSRYATAHGWLRHLLAGYLDVPAHALAFVADVHGKPRLRAGSARWLRFNLSHSGGVVVFAVARDREVGVDVEAMRDELDVEGISGRFLTDQQHHELMTMDPAGRSAAFFAAWTRNEAYLKGIGTGLDGGAHDLDRTPGWTVTGFDAGEGFAAAVAVEGTIDVPLRVRDLSLGRASRSGAVED